MTKTLVRRYTETHRRHPLGTDRPLTDVIRLERRLLMQLRNRADLLIDTTEKEKQRSLRRAVSRKWWKFEDGVISG